MIDDVDVKGSPAWWLSRLYKKLQYRLPRLQELDDRYRGNPPLPEGAENMREAYRKFQRKSRTNFAELIVEAPRSRMTPGGILTAATPKGAGDDVAKKVWDDNNLDVEIADVFESMLVMGDGYMIVGGIDAATGSPIITGEDPRQVVTIHDPARQNIVRAGLKLFHDDEDDRDLAYLYLPGEVWVAYREVRRRGRNNRISFSPGAWSWDLELTKKMPHDTPPIVRFRNRRGVGQFEPHIDVLDRINHTILQRMVITAMQAYRQRAIKGAPDHDPDGNEIDFEKIFSADPGAVWDLPAGVDLWESTPTDVTPILGSVKADVEHLAAVTHLPLSQFMPSAIAQSAEGASLAREGLTFIAEDRIKRANPAVKDVMHLAFLALEDKQRADRSKMTVLWDPVERRSLAERADAASKAADIPWRTRMLTIWGYSPEEVDRMEVERAQDAMLAPVALPATSTTSP